MIKDFNIKLVIKIISVFLFIESILMLLSSLVSFIYKENDVFPLLASGIISIIISLIALIFTGKEKGKINIRESFFSFTFLWIILSLFGTFPYLLTQAASFSDAFFESMSGFTTTGSSILTHIESFSKGLLFWRSSTQWLGGICFIVITLAVLPIVGTGGGMRTFSSEPISFHLTKLRPRMENSIMWLCVIYFSLTVFECVALKIAGMDIFDAVCHSFSTISTGGFSTKTDSVGFWTSSSIRIIFIVFMFLSGVNFTLYFYLVTGKFRKIIKDEELKYYVLFILFFSLIVALGLFFTMNFNFFDSIDTAFFQITSVISTSGFSITETIHRTPFLHLVILIPMFFGASSGSASGGIKTVRIMLILKNSVNELKRFVHPNAITPIKFNGKLIPLPIINNAFLFLLLYIFVVIAGVLFLSVLDIAFGDSVKIVLSTVGNIGSAASNHASLEGYELLPAVGKYFLALLMLIGRLELYAFFVLFTRSFWRK
ncbi:hypothetical protein LJC11_01475 [Bacteroidales bacterium OttesenSCG-928-I21]|nr:hypothetical protein [Bacteroidales bacterium OttesenSCG-928-I21]